MKALNRKDRRLAKWKVLSFFLPMLLVPVLGIALHYKIQREHIGDLDKKEALYEEVFRAQAKQGIEMEKIINCLEDLRQKRELTYLEHQNLQKEVYSGSMRIDDIRPRVPDTNLVRVRSIPAIYDSLISPVRLAQSTWDSIKVVDERLKNTKFQLDECLNAPDEEEAEQPGKKEDDKQGGK